MDDTEDPRSGTGGKRLAVDLRRAERLVRTSRPASSEEAGSVKTEVDPTERLALLAHEIRASLTAIKGFGITLREHLEDLHPRDRSFAIDAIVRGSDNLLRLADDLLASGKAEAGVFRLHYERVDMVAVAEEVIESERRLHPGLDFAFNSDPSLMVVGDPVMLGRALDNLIRNAAQHAPDGSCIDVEGTQVLDVVVISVRNEGAPPPPEIRDRLFEKYASGSEGGTGLGLYLTRLIVEAHGGSVYHLLDDSGNRFVFILPTRVATKRRTIVRLVP